MLRAYLSKLHIQRSRCQMVLSSNAPQNGTNVMDKDQWLIISGLQIRRDEAQRIPTLFRLFSMVGIRWEQIFYIISQVQFLPSSTILSPIRPTNNSKSVAFHTTVPMWSFNWS